MLKQNRPPSVANLVALGRKLAYGVLMVGFIGLLLGSQVNAQPPKHIKLGTLKNADAIRQALTGQGYRISDWASNILSKPAFTVASAETSLELVQVAVGELGFEQGHTLIVGYPDVKLLVTREQIYDRALKKGLVLCPAEVGPQLRLQYPDQPMGEWMLIAIEPIADSGGDLNVFCVERDSAGCWLHACTDAGYWDQRTRWVFARRH